MPFRSGLFLGLLTAIDRRHFQAIVARRGGDYYAKTMATWEHLVAEHLVAIMFG